MKKQTITKEEKKAKEILTLLKGLSVSEVKKLCFLVMQLAEKQSTIN